MTPSPDRPGDGDLPAEVRDAVRELARTPSLLVASDYDGTLAPIVDDPTAAHPLPETIACARALASLPATHVAVISGRALRDLAALSRLPSEVHLVGSHGSEFDLDFLSALDDDARALLHDVEQACRTLVDGLPGVWLEVKPASVAVHVRRASRSIAATVLGQVREGPAGWPGVHITEGKEVLELAVVRTDKGSAVDELRHQLGATAVLFVGDDVTDERAFFGLRGGDAGIKVGEGPTAARLRVADPWAVARVLALLAEERRAWLMGGEAIPIQHHALLSDGTTVALLAPDADIVWFCHPAPDSGAVFASLIGGEAAGTFSVAPASGRSPLSQAYVPGTMSVRTRWAGLDVVDLLDRSHRDDPVDGHQTRLLRMLQGSGQATVTFSPRPEFGQVPVSLVVEPQGIRVEGAAEAMVLVAPDAAWEIHNDGPHQVAVGRIELRDDPVILELRCGAADFDPVVMPVQDRRRASEEHWRDWAAGLRLPTEHRQAVERSALTLKALCHEPTGGILAAATTSLPEWIGGIRNWDYRYCWLRDAALTASTLLRLGSTGEAQAFLDWFHRVLDRAASPDRLHPLYSLEGVPLAPEAVVESLTGYAASRPVRIGNAAQGQIQLDVFGPVVELIHDLWRAEGRLSTDDLQLVIACVEAVALRWAEPDHGIWEIRDRPRQHVHSKVMCWVAVDRAIAITDGIGRPRPDWHDLREAIASDVLTEGWFAPRGTFVCAYDRHELDAAVLHLILSGLLPGEDPRALGTIAAVEEDLRIDSTVYRYRYDDGLPGDEGGMHICTAWLIRTYARAGRLDDADELLRGMLLASGRTGLLPEQIDPFTHQGLGNHPQAYSHLGLIEAVLEIEQARNRLTE